MNDRQFWTTFGGITAALALLFGYLIYSEHQSVDESRDEVASLRDLIASSRETVRKTPEI